MFALDDNDKTTRGHCWKLKCTKPRLNTRLYFFAYRTVKIWNKLKTETVSALTITVFKRKLLCENFSLVLSNGFK